MPGKNDGSQVDTESRPDANSAPITATILTPRSRNPQLPLAAYKARPRDGAELFAGAA
jgi:hypothetical protein